MLKKKSFADPTYDLPFKMLFGHEKHKQILISIINSLLNFHGPNQVKEVTLLSQELPLEYSGHIKTILDIRCSTNNGEEILVEMQRQYKEYFLPRTQHYMARMLAYKMKSGESGEHHSKLPQTYILVLSREDLFIRDYQLNLDNDELYEKTVVPMIKELNVEIPGNVMHWKYYEIQKFAKMYDAGKVQKPNDKLPIKEQWLYFLDKCGTSESIPNDIDETIKQAYNIMEMTNWGPETKSLYEKSVQKERDELIETEERENAALAKGREEGMRVTKLKERLSSDIDLIKNFEEANIGPEFYTPKLKCLNKKRFLERKWSENQLDELNKKHKPNSLETNKPPSEDIKTGCSKLLNIRDYVIEHKNDTPDTIYNTLNLLGDLEDIGYSTDLEVYNP